MFKRKIITGNCFAMLNGRMQQLPIGHVIETDKEDYFGSRAVTIAQAELKLEVATPETGSKEEDVLRDFIYEKTGQHASGNAKMSTLRKKARSLGYEG